MCPQIFFCLKEAFFSHIREMVVFSGARGREKDLFPKCSFEIFWKYVSGCRTFRRSCIKNNFIFRNFMKNESGRSDFSFSCDVIFRRWIDFENWKKCLKDQVFPEFCVHKNDAIMTLPIRYIADSVNVKTRAQL